jgi:hypothetical protein
LLAISPEGGGMTDMLDQRVLEGTDVSLPGLEADTLVTILNTKVATSESMVLGERVEFRVVGVVEEAGEKLFENEGRRRVVKVKAQLIQLLPPEE